MATEPCSDQGTRDSESRVFPTTPLGYLAAALGFEPRLYASKALRHPVLAATLARRLGLEPSGASFGDSLAPRARRIGGRWKNRTPAHRWTPWFSRPVAGHSAAPSVIGGDQ